MSNKQIIKQVFDEAFDSRTLHQQILLKYEKKAKMNIGKIMKYAIAPVFLILVSFIGISSNKQKSMLEENNAGIMRVYAYTMSENQKLEKKPLEDNVKLALASYNLAMSSVPGYPIEFEIDNLDYIKINVTNGTVSTWEKVISDEVESLGSIYELSKNETLYFNVNANTIIKIIGIKDKKAMFEKNITISMDDNFNYYAIIK